MKWIISIGVMVFFISFSKNDGDLTQIIQSSDAIYSDTLDMGNARTLTIQNCYSCHNPEMTGQPRIAPPIQMVRMHYIRDHDTEDDFVSAVMDWVRSPDAENSIMPGALKRFGIMPQMRIPEEEVRSIASYLYRTDMPSMHQSAGHNMHGQAGKRMNRTGMQQQSMAADQNNSRAVSDTTIPPKIIEQGQQYVNKAQSVLASNLLKAMERFGTDGAVDFCATRAVALTDSAAAALSIHIKRVTDRPRNPDNLANPDEAAFLLRAKSTLAAGNSIQPDLSKQGNTWRGYYPIITNPLCMNCHGSVEKDIDAATLRVIQGQYPDDRATGYTVPEVRGAWVVEFKEN